MGFLDARVDRRFDQIGDASWRTGSSSPDDQRTFKGYGVVASLVEARLSESFLLACHSAPTMKDEGLFQGLLGRWETLILPSERSH